MRGYFGIGIYHPKSAVNVGTLWRHANNFGASFVFTIGRRYKAQASDTQKTERHKPLFHYTDIGDAIEHLPQSCPLIAVELVDGAIPLHEFKHPERAVYLLGAEDHGLSATVLSRCHYALQIPTLLDISMNVAAAGTLVMYERMLRLTKKN